MMAEAAPATTSAPGFPARRVYAVYGVPPEVQAYAMAKYSRSSQGMLESIQELSAQKAEQFLNTFYFEYGHKSIADLAHVVFGLEQISILAAIQVADEQVWDGQERSTRYQPFRRTGWYTPDALRDSPLAATYQQTAQGLFTVYEQLSASLLDLLVDAVTRPAEMDDAAYRRTLRARAFDVARSLLPLGTHTSVGQVVSARVAERQISRLLASEYPEVQQIGQALREACSRPAEAPLLAQVPGPEDVLRPRPAPTLVKYAEPSAYRGATEQALRDAAATYLAVAGEPDRAHAVELAEPGQTPLEEMAATLLYAHDARGHSYRQVLDVVRSLSEVQQQEIFNLSLAQRGRYDELLREHQAGFALCFDVLVDLGSYRDLHRHRRCVQVAQPLQPAWEHGFTPTEDTFQAGLGDAAGLAALEAGLGDLYTETLWKAQQAASRIAAEHPLVADYLLPLAYRTRCLFKMDWAEAAYLIELRTAPAGHFSYRRIAWQMFQALREHYPVLAAPIRATDPTGPQDLLNR